MKRFINKNVIKNSSKRPFVLSKNGIITEQAVSNKKEEKQITEIMDTKEKVELAQAILSQENQEAKNVKKIKKDKGLIERVDSSKTILTEDNKELLND